MDLFISYARSDAAVVDGLHSDLVLARQQAWYDREVQGGEAWWQQITEQIRRCDAFVFVLSPASASSRACLTELGYAISLKRPLLPVRVRDVDERLAPDPIPSLQIIDYRSRTPEAVIRLVSAINSVQKVPLPDPEPRPPPAPMISVEPIREKLAEPSLSYATQLDLVRDLRERLGHTDESDVVVSLLHQMRERPDVVESIARDIDTLLASAAGPSPADRGSRGGSNSASLDLLRSLVTQIRRNHFTPILGWGVTDSLVGPRRLLARQWARTFEFPMAAHEQEDLPQVARFVAVMTDTETLRESLAEFYREQLHARFPSALPHDSSVPLDELTRAAWGLHIKDHPDDVHNVFARLACPVYVTAHPTTLLAEAIRMEGREPRVELCRWRPDVYDWPASVFEVDPGYVPDVEHPLIFHIFGNLDFADSLVITEDDYVDFAVSVAENPALIPLVVRDSLADSSLLFLGFGLDEWDVRVLLRALVTQQGAKRLRKYTHVAAQIDLRDEVIAPDRARRYLERYFGKFREPAIDIFWGTVDEFSARLADVWKATP